jgi:all-trans-retinol 13,14-reductase
VSRYSTFVLPGWLTHLRDFRDAPSVLGEEVGSRIPPYVFVDYSRIDSGLNPSPPYSATFCGSDNIGNWTGLTPEASRARREHWLESILADFNGHFPGIVSAVVQREMATAETMAQYLNTPGGAVYGFDSDAAMLGPKYMTPKTPIRGLWLASAFVSAGGFTGAMMGGAAAARAALRSS